MLFNIDKERRGSSGKKTQMQQDASRLRTLTFVLMALGGVVSILLFGILTVLAKMRPRYAGLIAIAVYILITALIWFLSARKTKKEYKSEDLAPVMGRIMFDAVVDMKSPVFICDSKERIVWYNAEMENLFDRNFKLYEKSISEVFGFGIKELHNVKSARGHKFSYGKRTYYARYDEVNTENNNFLLVMTEDATNEERLTTEMKQNEPVVAYIVIDNFMEMMQYDSELYRPVLSSIDEVIREWVQNYSGILKEYERDKYLFITDARTLSKMIEKKFDLLDNVRNVMSGEISAPVTISMGVSGIKGTFEEKEKAASAALDMALQRGGDQAAVKTDYSMDFFGGVTKTVTKRTSVRSRVIAGELMTLIRKSSNVLIMGHKFADFDAIGSCVGLARIAMHCGKRVNIIIDMDDKNLFGPRALISQEPEFSGVFVDTSEAMDLLETGTLVIMSDLNDISRSEEPELARRTEKFVVIDHHIKKLEFEKEPDIEYIEPSASAACELVAEMLEQVLPKDALTPAEANVMLAGITLDTSQFTKNTGTRTFSAAMYLRDRGADPAVVKSLFRESFDDYVREAQFRGNVQIYRNAFAITEVGPDVKTDGSYRVIAAKAADNLLKVEKVEASFAVIKIADIVHVSARSSGKVNVQKIMETLGGGGHFDGAAAQIKAESVEDVIVKLKEAIDEYMGR